MVSPKDVVVGKPRDEDDHIDWLLEHNLFAGALDFAEAKARLLRRHNVLKVIYNMENPHNNMFGSLFVLFKILIKFHIIISYSMDTEKRSVQIESL